MKFLFNKYLDNTINLAELEELYHYFNGENDPILLRKLIQEKLSELENNATKEEVEQAYRIESAAWTNIQSHLQQTRARNGFNFKRLLYAASILLVLGGLLTFFFHKTSNENTPLTSKYGDDVLPNVNQATILLSDGTQYDLKESKQGIQIDEQGIYYEDGSILTTDAAVHATVSTSKGGQYRITLPDGTKVILNTASSLQYPTQFAGHERRVLLDGEAYFEVAKNANQPFRVESSTQVLEVLGTRFNLSTYTNTPIITTLVEGSVQLKDHKTSAILQPGQQAIQQNDGFQIQEIETSDYTAWINNQFIFNNSPLIETFAQLERWYDVSFDYPKEILNQRIYAEIGRNRKLSEVIEALEEVVNLKFKIEGRRVIVRK